VSVRRWVGHVVLLCALLGVVALVSWLLEYDFKFSLYGLSAIVLFLVIDWFAVVGVKRHSSDDKTAQSDGTGP
jgi:L-asparagine transporter-like permease